MKRLSVFMLVLTMLMPLVAWAALPIPDRVTTATVLIANYNADDDFVGWGSGFFVDEGIVITNKHVLAGGAWHRVYASTLDGDVNFDCYKNITKSDTKINLEDDVAYMRVYLPCSHSVMQFAEDPWQDDALTVVGYRYSGSIESSLKLTVTTGTVTGQTDDGWLSTNAVMDKGNSGGPVVDGEHVIGVAVAKAIDQDGLFIEGYFIPSSVILKGLLYANDSRFGYTAQTTLFARSRSSQSSSASSVVSVGSSHTSSSRRSIQTSSARSSMSPFQERTCKRVEKYRKESGVFKRLNERLMKRYGFVCR